MACYPEKIKGRLTGTWLAEAFIEGKRVRSRFPTQREGETWASLVKLTGGLPNASANGATAPKGPTWGLVASEALAAGGPGGTWKRGRDRNVRQRLDYVTGFIGKDTLIADVGTPRLDKLVDDLAKRPSRGGRGKLSPSTVNRYLSFASAVLKFAVERGHLKGTPVVPWQKEDGERLVWLSDADEDAICAALASKGHADEVLCVRVLTATGMRWGELAGLEPAQVEDEWVRLWKTKTDRPRSIPISHALARQLRELVAAKRVPKHNTMHTRFKAAVKSSGRSSALCLHSLRHTTASRLVERGVNLKIVQQLLGHATIATTMKYAHINDEALVEAVKKLAPHSGRLASAPAFEVITNPAKLGTS